MSKRKLSTLKKSDYLHWIGELKKRYRATQIKAAVAVNSAMIEFYWSLGKDISERYPGKRRGLDFFGKLSRDLQHAIPESGSFSTRNLKYMLAFFEMYAYRQQLVADKGSQGYVQQLVADKELRTLLSLGKGVAFLGREYPIEIGGETKNIDLLFYIVPLHRYLVMEVKTSKYEPADLGQLSGYLVMAKHVLNTPEDNPPIGLLVCKDHNRVLAKYHLEELGLPMGITDYALKKILPTQAQLAKCYADAEAQFAASVQKAKLLPRKAKKSKARKGAKES